ncbi:MAG: GNAT family N-acetyltransferase [Pseudonocardiales bacterium]|nr:GNAT family N-acetyltransferase [Pseudonocardiales bacterium]
MALLVVDQASPDELPLVLELLDEAARWLSERGIKQWPARFTGAEDWRIQRIRAYIENGHTWLVRINATAVATFTLSAADPDYADGWPDGPDTGLYIYRMAIRRQFAGHDIGGQILDWSSARAAALGYRWLRLDCHRDNPALQNYYQARGFERVGTLVRVIDAPVSGDANGRYVHASGALFQRPAGSILISYTEQNRDRPTVTFERYDPHNEAAIWQDASDIVASLKTDDQPQDPDAWNTALDQASRLLERQAIEIRQRNGMYYRSLTGSAPTVAPADDQ